MSIDLLTNISLSFLILFLLSVSIVLLHSKFDNIHNPLLKQTPADKFSFKDYSYRKLVILYKVCDKAILENAALLKMPKQDIEQQYMKLVSFSLAFASISFLASATFFNLWAGMFSLVISYVIANYLFSYHITEETKQYKRGLSHEVINLFLTFHLLYPTYKNPDTTLRKVISNDTSLEINRQIESMLVNVAEKGLESGVEEMKQSIEGVAGFDVFIELYYNLKKEGVKAMQNINTYVSNIIQNKELDAEKKINETKARVEVVMALVVFVGMAIMILAPMFLGKFDGENTLLDYLGFKVGV